MWFYVLVTKTVHISATPIIKGTNKVRAITFSIGIHFYTDFFLDPSTADGAYSVRITYSMTCWEQYTYYVPAPKKRTEGKILSPSRSHYTNLSALFLSLSLLFLSPSVCIRELCVGGVLPNRERGRLPSAAWPPCRPVSFSAPWRSCRRRRCCFHVSDANAEL